MAASESRVIRFGVYTLDLASGELRKNGTRIRLQEQPFQALKALVERPGEVVTREELQQALWPEGTFVDFEDGLATAVRKVRNALGDSATNPRFIETLPKRGYRFLAPVEGDGRNDPASRKSPEGSPPREAPRRYGPAAAALVVVAVVASAILYFLGGAREPVPDLSLYAETPLTNYRGMEGGPSLSPDGNQVAFAWRGESGDNQDIYIKQVDSMTEEPFRLTDDAAFDFSPAWSPDGRWIAFIRQAPSERMKSKVMVAPALGGPPRTVGQRLARLGRVPLFSQLAWSPDGRYLAFSSLREASDHPQVSLAIVPVEGGDVRWLDAPDADYGAASPAFSPDGERIAFIQRQGWASGQDAYVSELEPDMTPRGEPVRLTEFARSVGNPVWTGDGQELLFWGENSSGQAGLWAVSAFDGSAPRLVRPSARLNSLPFYNTLSIAADESGQVHRLAFAVGTEDQDIWEVNVDGPLAGRPRPLVSTNAIEAGAFVSPDGSRVAFVSDRSGDRELWIAGRDGSRAAQLTKLGAERMGLGGWSPDGASILFHSFANGQADIYLADPDTGECTQLTFDPSDEQQSSWSRDGEWIYFQSRQEGGRIMRIAPDGSESKAVLEVAGSFPRESWDGSKLVYNQPESGAVMMVSLMNGEPTGQPQALPLARGTLGIVGPGGLYYVDEDGLSFFDLKQGDSRHVFPLDTGLGGPLSLTADGKTLILHLITRDSDLRLLRAPEGDD